MTSVIIVALTILGEARGEGDGGMYRVACVIQQRQINRGMSAKAVCLERRQFSCWNKRGGPPKSLLNSAEGKRALQLAKQIEQGQQLKRHLVGSADHYCTLKTFPKWAKGHKPVAVYGNHKFFKLKKGKK